VVHDWPGARSLFSPHVHADITTAIDAVIGFADAGDILSQREALSRSMKPHDIDAFTRTFFHL
jgi:hypothetical protein